jgi:hypothetical protein
MKKLSCFIILVCALVSVHAQEDTTLKQYTGTYKFPDGSIVPSVEITLNNGLLTANSQMGPAGLEKISKDTFSLPAYNGMIYFTRDANNKVNGLRVEAQDVILEGKKEGMGLAWLRSGKIYYCKVNFNSMIAS